MQMTVVDWEQKIFHTFPVACSGEVNNLSVFWTYSKLLIQSFCHLIFLNKVIVISLFFYCNV